MQKAVVEEYLKHTALNLGQVARDVRYFYYHPDVDQIATEGTLKHYSHSVVSRFKSLGNNLFYSIVPPHWHHSKRDLEAMRDASARAWFLHGYAPWRFPNPLNRD